MFLTSLQVISFAAGCIRMAIAIQTAHAFTIKQLVSKLSEKYCDAKGCGKVAPYLDIFSLTRRCLSVGRGCPYPRGPINKNMLLNKCDIDENASLPPQYFQCLSLPPYTTYGL